MSAAVTASHRTASILQQYVDEPESTPLSKTRLAHSTAALHSPFSPLFRPKQQQQPSNDSALEKSSNNDTDTSALSLSMCRKVSVVVNVLSPSQTDTEHTTTTTNNACLFDDGPKNIIVVNPHALNRLPTNVTISVSQFLQQQSSDTEDWARTYKFHAVTWPHTVRQQLQTVATALSNDICAAGSIAHRTVIGTCSSSQAVSTSSRLCFGTIVKQSVAKVFATRPNYEYNQYDAETILSTYGLLGLTVSQILLQHIPCRVSVLEVRDEETLCDLLSSKPFDKHSSRVHLKFDGALSVVVGLSETKFDSLKGLGHLMRRAFYSAWHLHRRSRRGHIVVTIHCGSNSGRTTSLRFVDLAQLVENVDHHSSSSPANVRRNASIRKSTWALGGILRSSLLQEAGNQSTISFRESTLTRVLHKPLSTVDSKVLILASVQEDVEHYESTMQTLRYVNRLLYRPGEPVHSPFANNNSSNTRTVPQQFEWEGLPESRLLKEVVGDPRQRIARVYQSPKSKKKAATLLEPYVPTLYDDPNLLEGRRVDQSSMEQLPTPIATNAHRDGLVDHDTRLDSEEEDMENDLDYDAFDALLRQAREKEGAAETVQATQLTSLRLDDNAEEEDVEMNQENEFALSPLVTDTGRDEFEDYLVNESRTLDEMAAVVCGNEPVDHKDLEENKETCETGLIDQAPPDPSGSLGLMLSEMNNYSDRDETERLDDWEEQISHLSSRDSMEKLSVVSDHRTRNNSALEQILREASGDEEVDAMSPEEEKKSITSLLRETDTDSEPRLKKKRDSFGFAERLKNIIVGGDKGEPPRQSSGILQGSNKVPSGDFDAAHEGDDDFSSDHDSLRNNDVSYSNLSRHGIPNEQGPRDATRPTSQQRSSVPVPPTANLSPRKSVRSRVTVSRKPPTRDFDAMATEKEKASEHSSVSTKMQRLTSNSGSTSPSESSNRVFTYPPTRSVDEWDTEPGTAYDLPPESPEKAPSNIGFPDASQELKHAAVFDNVDDEPSQNLLNYSLSDEGETQGSPVRQTRTMERVPDNPHTVNTLAAVSRSVPNRDSTSDSESASDCSQNHHDKAEHADVVVAAPGTPIGFEATKQNGRNESLSRFDTAAAEASARQISNFIGKYHDDSLQGSQEGNHLVVATLQAQVDPEASAPPATDPHLLIEEIPATEKSPVEQDAASNDMVVRQGRVVPNCPPQAAKQAVPFKKLSPAKVGAETDQPAERVASNKSESLSNVAVERDNETGKERLLYGNFPGNSVEPFAANDGEEEEHALLSEEWLGSKDSEAASRTSVDQVVDKELESKNLSPDKIEEMNKVHRQKGFQHDHAKSVAANASFSTRASTRSHSTKVSQHSALEEIDELQAAVDRVKETNLNVWQASLDSLDNLRSFQESQREAVASLKGERDQALENVEYLESELQKRAETYRSFVRQHEEQVEAANAEISKVTRERSEVVKIAEEAIQTQAELEERLNQLEEQFSEHVSKSVPKDKYSYLQQAHESLEENVNELSAEILHYKSELTDRNITISELKLSADGYQRECEYLSQERTKARNEILSLRHDLDSRATAEKELQEARGEIDQLQREISLRESSVDKELREKALTIEKWKEEATRVTELFEELREEATHESSDAQNELRRLNEELSALKIELAETQAQLADSERKLGELEEENTELSSQLLQTREELDRRVSDVQELSTNLRNLMSERENDNLKIRTMEDTLANFQDETRTRVENVVRSRDQTASLLKKAVSENQALEESNRRLQLALEELQSSRDDSAVAPGSRVEEMEKQNQDLVEDNERLERELIQMRRLAEDDNRPLREGYDRGPRRSIRWDLDGPRRGEELQKAEEVAAYLALSAKSRVKTSDIHEKLYELEDRKDEELTLLKQRIKALERRVG